MSEELPVRVKVCGLTRDVDLVAAKKLGARYFGQIFYPKSPRCVSEETAAALRDVAPFGSRVAVDVEPTAERLERYLDSQYHFVQLHFRPEKVPADAVEQWSWSVSPDRLWLAPKLPTIDAFDPAWLPFADTFLIDSYSRNQFGGTGKTGDWEGFRRLRETYPDKTFILAGGLTAENVREAIAATGATVIDVNSGVEAEPGIKSQEKLAALFAALREG